jgi:hypothetical protein
MKRKGFREENQIVICTDNCALMHRLSCNLMKDVKLRVENPFGES